MMVLVAWNMSANNRQVELTEQSHITLNIHACLFPMWTIHSLYDTLLGREGLKLLISLLRDQQLIVIHSNNLRSVFG